MKCLRCGSDHTEHLGENEWECLDCYCIMYDNGDIDEEDED